ncbi:hypothetical protein EBQ34_08280 [Vandammella animalimorsus]|uniref:Uncharacterized protein n=1 Tax=Vandammella animalimorsus TaxID=2029117 RepID=A0A3M6RI56_9BURK|nr:hypothetical protein EBQ34_08280 [Vandammella animalimorsus]
MQALVPGLGLGSVPAWEMVQALGWVQVWAQALVSGRGGAMASARVKAWAAAQVPAAAWARARAPAPGSEWALAGGSGLAVGRPLAGFAARRPVRAPVLDLGWGRAQAACPARAGPHRRPRRRRRPG